jgi:hypothetical protein
MAASRSSTTSEKSDPKKGAFSAYARRSPGSARNRGASYTSFSSRPRVPAKSVNKSLPNFLAVLSPVEVAGEEMQRIRMQSDGNCAVYAMILGLLAKLQKVNLTEEQFTLLKSNIINSAARIRSDFSGNEIALGQFETYLSAVQATASAEALSEYLRQTSTHSVMSSQLSILLAYAFRRIGCQLAMPGEHEDPQDHPYWHPTIFVDPHFLDPILEKFGLVANYYNEGTNDSGAKEIALASVTNIPEPTYREVPDGTAGYKKSGLRYIIDPSTDHFAINLLQTGGVGLGAGHYEMLLTKKQLVTVPFYVSQFSELQVSDVSSDKAASAASSKKTQEELEDEATLKSNPSLRDNSCERAATVLINKLLDSKRHLAPESLQKVIEFLVRAVTVRDVVQIEKMKERLIQKKCVSYTKSLSPASLVGYAQSTAAVSGDSVDGASDKSASATVLSGQQPASRERDVEDAAGGGRADGASGRRSGGGGARLFDTDRTGVGACRARSASPS